MQVLLPLILLAFAAPDDPLDRAPAILLRIRPAVEEVTGRRFAEPPEVLIASEEAAMATLEDDLRPRIRLLYPGTTEGQVRTLLRRAAGASVKSCVARYSPTRKAILLVRGGFERQLASLGLEPEDAESLLTHTLAHECVHALDDQRFGLEALFAGATDREALRARAMLIEGRAEHFGAEVSARLGLPEKVTSVRPGGTDPENPKGIYFGLLYEKGRSFTAHLLERGGAELADRAMREPPVATYFLCHPDRWPDAKLDPRPEELLRAAYPGATAETLSELQLLARYTERIGREKAEAVFAAYCGGVQAIVKETNAAVLAFATEEAAQAYLVLSLEEVPATRAGTLVVRAAGPRAEEVHAALAANLE